MKLKFKVGDRKNHFRVINEIDLAKFESGQVHPVLSTFALGREMEWSSRLFVLEMLEDEEEGIGTRLEIDHISPAVHGERIDISATIKSINRNEIICTIEVKVKDRLIAKGITGQKILKRTKIAALIKEIEENG